MGSFRTAGDHAPLPVHLPEIHPVHAGRRILVTGAARGLGKALAQLLTRQGALVWIVDVLERELVETAEELGLGDRYSTVDVADESSVIAGVAAVRAGLGGFDGLANIAGIVRHADPADIPWHDWERVHAVNVIGSYKVAQQVARTMIEDGTHGSIVNTASEAGKIGHVDSLAYSASKAAVISMSRMLAEALAPHDINVNCVCPGGMPTAMLREVAEVYAEIVRSDADSVFGQLISSQLRRQTALEEVAHVYSFLLSDAAGAVRGQAVNADGGDTPY